MELGELYKQYREEQLFFVNERLIKSLEDEVIMNSAIALDMIDEKGHIINNDENSINYILDFSIFEYKIDGKNAIERYVEKHEAVNEMEERVINALLNSYSSLYRVVNISPLKHMVFLKDAFNQSKNVRIMDITFSQTMDTSSLVFSRILPFPELNMTSGAPLVFPDYLEMELVSKYKKLTMENIEDTSTNKFIWFYNISRYEGLNVDFRHTSSHHEHHHHGHHHNHHDHDCCCGHDH